jgi:hypothetical protein
VSSTRTDATVLVRTDKPATGGGLYLSLVGRRVTGAGDYRAKVRLLATGQVSIQLIRASATGAETALAGATTVPGLVYDPAVGVRIRIQVTGTNPTTVRARVWSAATAEPTSWTTTTTDTTAALQAVGGVGAVGYLSSSATNAPIVTRFDELIVAPVP